MSEILLIGDRRPDSLLITDIYDPDVDGTDVTASGKTVPQAGSTVIDAETDILYYVHHVDPITLKTTLRYPRIVSQGESEDDTIISYGNDIYHLYYDDRVNPVSLFVDDKFALFGTNSSEYRLVKYDQEGNGQVISSYVDSNGDIIGDRPPVVYYESTGVIKCSKCYTFSDITEGESVHLEIFDGKGILKTFLVLVCKRAIILNDFASASNPIVDFTAECNQTDGEDWILYTDQTIDDLNIYPKLTYSNSTEELVTLDYQNCFMYGTDEVVNIYPGKRFPVMIKYYLAFDQVSPLGTLDTKNREFITLVRDVVIKVREFGDYSKVSTIPKWNPNTLRWDLRFFAYNEDRSSCKDVTNSVTYIDQYDPMLINQNQTITISVPYSEQANKAPYEQSITLTIRSFNDGEPYLIKDTPESSLVYGVNNSLYRRPVIHFDSTIEQYFIPTSVFPTTEEFVEAFYNNASPPMLIDTEVEPPAPTHFTFRNTSGQVLLAMPVEVTQYDQAMNILGTGIVSRLVNTNIVVEFLIKDGDNYRILYGAPVDVKNSPTGYNI